MLEPSEKSRKERSGLVGDSEGSSELIGDNKKVLGDQREWFEVTVVVEEEIEYEFPTFFWQIYIDC